MDDAISPLEDLLAPLTAAEFMSILRDRKLTHLRGTHRDRFTNLVGWEALRKLIERGEHPRGSDFNVFKESAPISPERWAIDGKLDAEKLEDCLADGNSIVITHLERNVPFLATLCNDIKARLYEWSFAGVVVSSSSDGAFKLHYDNEDLVILQIEGTKRWQISGPAISHPVGGLEKPKAPENPPFFDEVLEPGDFLFVPAGNWHHCQTKSGRSVHLGIFFVPPTFVHAVRGRISKLFSIEMFRLPLTRIETTAELATLETDVKDCLSKTIAELKLSDFLAEWSEKLKADGHS